MWQMDLAPIINFIVSGILQVFTWMENVRFLGTNLLTFCVTILVLGTLLPLLFTIQKNSTNMVGGLSMRPSSKDANERGQARNYNEWKEGGFK